MERLCSTSYRPKRLHVEFALWTVVLADRSSRSINLKTTFRHSESNSLNNREKKLNQLYFSIYRSFIQNKIVLRYHQNSSKKPGHLKLACHFFSPSAFCASLRRRARRSARRPLREGVVAVLFTDLARCSVGRSNVGYENFWSNLYEILIIKHGYNWRICFLNQICVEILI